MRHLPLLPLLALCLLGACSTRPPSPSAALDPPLSSPTPAAAPTATRTPTPAFELPLAPAELDALRGAVAIGGSSTVFPISETAIAHFQRLAPGLQLSLGVSGTGGGFRAFCAGELLVAGASRPIDADERESCAAAGISFVELPVAYDGLSVIVHPTNSWATCATLAELRRMWEPAAEGVVQRWSDVRPDWPDRPLHLYGAGADSGTFDYFMAAVVGSEGASRRDYTASEDDYLIAQDLVADAEGLGFFGYTYLVEYAELLQPVAIDSGAGCVLPSEQTIADGSYQPLSRPLFIYVQAAALEQNAALRAFVAFYISNGAALAREVNAIPLPQSVYELALARLERRTTGSVFAEGMQVGLSIEELLALESSP